MLALDAVVRLHDVEVVADHRVLRRAATGRDRNDRVIRRWNRRAIRLQRWRQRQRVRVQAQVVAMRVPEDLRTGAAGLAEILIRQEDEIAAPGAGIGEGVDGTARHANRRGRRILVETPTRPGAREDGQHRNYDGFC